jgi:hypothetical protein
MGDCQSCNRPDAASPMMADGEPPYLVCDACAHRLEMRSLRPGQWFRLAALHGWNRFLLHDDFYDDDGTATQPEEEVESPGQHPFPSRDEWTNSLSLALDVAYVKWQLPHELVAVFSSKPDETLLLLRVTTAARKSPQIRARALEIAARSIGSPAADWVRAQWTESPQTVLNELSRAAAACLPRGEALDLVVSAIGSTESRIGDQIGCLSWFRHEAALDAIERLVQTPITGSWGRAAAACGLSWKRASRWLQAGRPLSLVALDALIAMSWYDTPLLMELQPHLIGPVDVASFRQVLSQYAENDDVPRVKRVVTTLLASAHEIVRQQVSDEP